MLIIQGPTCTTQPYRPTTGLIGQYIYWYYMIGAFRILRGLISGEEARKICLSIFFSYFVIFLSLFLNFPLFLSLPSFSSFSPFQLALMPQPAGTQLPIRQPKHGTNMEQYIQVKHGTRTWNISRAVFPQHGFVNLVSFFNHSATKTSCSVYFQFKYNCVLNLNNLRVLYGVIKCLCQGNFLINHGICTKLLQSKHNSVRPISM